MTKNKTRPLFLCFEKSSLKKLKITLKDPKGASDFSQCRMSTTAKEEIVGEEDKDRGINPFKKPFPEKKRRPFYITTLSFVQKRWGISF